MRTITSEWKSDIEQAATADLLGNLPAAAAEKDVHITDALRGLSRIRIVHTAHRTGQKKGDLRPATVDIASQLVFAGGTCLSKAHGLIERMSEDIDIKVVLEEVPDGYALSKGQSDRARLGDIQTKVCHQLESIGFTLTVVEDESNPVSRDNRRCYCLAVDYNPEFTDISGVLRPQLKVELIRRHPKLELQMLDFGYLADRFIGRQSVERAQVLCISIAETLAEKVLSLLRRCAWYWDGHQRGDFDTALVRHIYDVWRINTSSPEAVDEAGEVFEALVLKDLEEFEGQNPEFDADPYAILRRTLARAATDDGLRRNFDQRLVPLLFAEDKPSFDICFSSFNAVAETLLSTQAVIR
jgi:hypothetical protein